jgi:NAD(P)H dehydrogenase (quinone)
MMHAVIVAHPNPDSFTCAVANAYAAAVRGLGQEAVVRDLYRLDFDPRLKADEIPDHPGYRAAPDVAAERLVVGGADVFAFVYPFWFNAPPAILKGYADRVFGAGFGYAPALGVTQPLLKGRRLISFSSSGAPDAWINQTNALEALMTVFDRHVAGVCGLSVIDHVHSGGIVPGVTAESVEAILDDVGAVVRRHFGPPDSS